MLFQKERGLFKALCFYVHLLQVWYTLKRKKLTCWLKAMEICPWVKFDFAIKWVCYKWWNCFSAKLFTNREILTLRYMNVRIILEDIKILLFSNVAFVIAFSKLCVILAKFIYTFSLFQLFWREAIGLKLHLSQN